MTPRSALQARIEARERASIGSALQCGRRGSGIFSRRKEGKFGAEMTPPIATASTHRNSRTSISALQCGRKSQDSKRNARTPSPCTERQRTETIALSGRFAELEDGQVLPALDVAHDELELSMNAAPQRRRCRGSGTFSRTIMKEIR
jgi:hypothetical protein